MTELFHALTQLELRLQSGESFSSALRTMPSLRAPAEIIEAWEALRDSSTRGEVSALQGIGHFKEYLRLQTRLTKLIQQKTFRPKAQAVLALGLSLLFLGLARVFLGPAALGDGALPLTALSLIVASFGWMKKIEKDFLASLWFNEWNFWLLKLSLGMSWGRTLAGALRDCPPPGTSTRWPRCLRQSLRDFQEKILSARIEEWRSPPLSNRNEESQALFQLGWLARMAASGHPMAGPLREMAQYSLLNFEETLNERAQRNELYLLLPLFLLNLPAFLMLEFGPIFALLRRGLGTD